MSLQSYWDFSRSGIHIQSFAGCILESIVVLQNTIHVMIAHIFHSSKWNSIKQGKYSKHSVNWWIFWNFMVKQIYTLVLESITKFWSLKLWPMCKVLRPWNRFNVPFSIQNATYLLLQSHWNHTFQHCWIHPVQHMSQWLYPHQTYRLDCESWK